MQRLAARGGATMDDLLTFLDGALKLGTDVTSFVSAVARLKQQLGSQVPTAAAPMAMPAQGHAVQVAAPWAQQPVAAPMQVPALLSGVWAPPMSPLEQVQIQQFGPYVQLVSSMNG